MKFMKKRMCAWLLSLALLCTFLPTAAFAADDLKTQLGITTENVTITEASNESKETMSAAAAKRNWGLWIVTDENGAPIMGDDGWPVRKLGYLLSPFCVSTTQNDDTVTISMNAPEKSPPLWFRETVLYAVIQDVDGSVRFFPTKEIGTTVSFTIPVSDQGTNVALVEIGIADDEVAGYYGQAAITQTGVALENAAAPSKVPYKLSYTMVKEKVDFFSTSPGYNVIAGGATLTVNLVGTTAFQAEQVTLNQDSRFDLEQVKQISPNEVQFTLKLPNKWCSNKQDAREFLAKEVTISFDALITNQDFLLQGELMFKAPGDYGSENTGWAAVEMADVTLTPAVTFVPEDITIYSGGVGGDSANPEFPHPIYLKMNSDKTTENADQMTFKIDGSDTTYHADDLFTVKYYDNAGQEITADSTYGDYTAKIVVRDQYQSKTILTSDGMPVSFGTGTLRIRYVSSFTDASENALTAIAQQYDNSTENNKQAAAIEVEKTEKAGILLDKGATIYLNGNTKYPYPAGFTSGIALLFDDLLPTHSGGDNSTYKDALVKHAADKGFDISGMNTQFQYLDLVDTNDSNAWVSSSQGVDVFWPYPSGVDANTSLTLLHFTGLHREYAMPGQDTLPEQIADAGVESVSFTRGNGGIWFHVDQNGFSPFALVWETTSVDPDPGDGGGTGTRDDYTLHYVTNGGKHLSSETKSSAWTKDYEDLPIPVRDGYTFEGWYWDLRLTEPVTGDVKVNKTTVTLYAKWSGGNYGPDDTGVSKWLETDEHNAFLSGYPDGSFLADKNMTRAEVAQMFYSLLLDKDVKITKSFSDVPTDAWYAKAVNTLSSLGMLGGYPDGTFRPDAPITRAEFAAIALAFAYDPASASCSYTDVSTSAWYYTYVAQATTYGWIGGYPDGSFRPNNSITRAEVAVIVNNMLGRSADESYIDRNTDELVSFVDLSKTHWAYYTIMEATNTHDYTTSSNGESWK